MSATVQEILEPGGLLDEVLPQYEFRPQQVQMAQGVWEALQKRRPLIVEAATGTGKTLAYLIPAILSGKKVVISTGTKALQEQLFAKDIPFLQRHLPRTFEAVLLKGRRNYLCEYRLAQMHQNPTCGNLEEMRLWPKIERWAKKTKTGDRAEIEGMPDHYAPWSQLSVSSEACLGSKCKWWEECFVQKARRRAQKADIIVVNHHLFFADLVLRQRGVAEILPEYDAVVFDEAHHLEEVATSYFGLHISNYRFSELAGDVERVLEEERASQAVLKPVRAASARMEKMASGLFELLRDALEPKGRQGLREVVDGAEKESMAKACKQAGEALESLGIAIRSVSLGEAGQRLAQRCQEIKKELETVLGAEDERFAYVAERRDRGVFLEAAPIDLADEMRTRLLDTHDALIFTSATLATGGDFSYFKSRLGITGDSKEGAKEGGGQALAVEELVLDAVFDYEKQCLLYVPHRLPAPRDPNFCENVALIVDYLVGITQGRAFVLFTSVQNMRDVHGRLEQTIKYPVLLQGDASKRELLEKFRSTPHAVLFATASFWEGVDVEGESLSLVVIDKLPFGNPSDPLTRARFEQVEARGGNSFREISLPTAAITLRQGFGRLIRSAKDSGVVAILDSRIAHKSYGRYFLKSLPPAPVVWRAAEVKRWWREEAGRS